MFRTLWKFSEKSENFLLTKSKSCDTIKKMNRKEMIKMSEYNYVVNAYYGNAQATLQTNDLQVAVNEMMEHAQGGVHCDLVNGQTGEVLAIANHPEQFCALDIAEAFLVWLMENVWGE
jgi:hypothetical protein